MGRYGLRKHTKIPNSSPPLATNALRKSHTPARTQSSFCSFPNSVLFFVFVWLGDDEFRCSENNFCDRASALNDGAQGMTSIVHSRPWVIALPMIHNTAPSPTHEPYTNIQSLMSKMLIIQEVMKCSHQSLMLRTAVGLRTPLDGTWGIDVDSSQSPPGFHCL